MNPKIIFWSLLVGCGQIIAVFTTLPTQATAPRAERNINERISEIRKVITEEQGQSADDNPAVSEEDNLIARWHNWHNNHWRNWHNWHNNHWRNWHNWGNWGNWGNY
ncbi:hypothetical protein G7B40_033840 [Aetokthonos hydrillicola Thurmond2011]|jgi:hypothetical protein|uniref:RSAM-associated Gly-rich repeat protein n=1 Tax=Aetokthonos hydrillicola Thurmond2011 TaxID=2712845 RepID=A0AAP5IHD3_9CYAN|nr:hypothetical protein [Aetokthonos hydrillicola]MBO3459734.1 hypothetical protein [Aetokthonos hydrillicola CCALA 1050]MBW4585166.1 hypothetical protein [Aetokthonos hydrillicola CCALA 1050]MDR9899505.1 hypothetical protein [Aetokthonos hydrillicola Thurmond2011]